MANHRSQASANIGFFVLLSWLSSRLTKFSCSKSAVLYQKVGVTQLRVHVVSVCKIYYYHINKHRNRIPRKTIFLCKKRFWPLCSSPSALANCICVSMHVSIYVIMSIYWSGKTNGVNVQAQFEKNKDRYSSPSARKCFEVLFFSFFDHSPLTSVSWGVCGTSTLFELYCYHWKEKEIVNVQIHFCDVQMRIHYPRTLLLGFCNRLCGAVRVLESAIEVQSRYHLHVEQTPSVDGLLRVNDGWTQLLLRNTRTLCSLVSSVFCSVWGKLIHRFLEVPYGLRQGHLTTCIQNQTKINHDFIWSRKPFKFRKICFKSKNKCVCLNR